MGHWVAGAVLGFGLIGAAVVPADVARAADAKELFVSGRCMRCHSVEAQGIAAKPRAGEEDEVTDLSKAGADRTAEWMQQYLRREADIGGVKHRQKYRGSDEDLKTLALWLALLK
jgi:cytochrome c553